MSDFQTEPFLRPVAQHPPATAPAFPAPPKLHWSLVLLFTFMSLGIFIFFWMFIQANWAQKVDPESKVTAFLVGDVLLFLLSLVCSAATDGALKGLELLFLLGSYVAFYIAAYSIRRTMLDHYNKAESMQLQMSGAMTFFSPCCTGNIT